MGDEVHQACNAIRTIQHRGRATHDFNSLQQADVKVITAKCTRAEHVGARRANAVHQHQHAVAIEPADIEPGVGITASTALYWAKP